MGTWGTAINSNDTSSDIYATFFDLYNEGKEPLEIGKKLIQDNQELIANPDESNNFWFTLGWALWETKSLDQETFNKVKALIESGKDLDVWRELNADESDIRKRKIVLENFLEKISIEKDKPKARKKKRIKDPIFEKGACLIFRFANGNYGGAVVLEADRETSYGYNLIVTTRINQSEKPTLKDFRNAKVLVASYGNWKNEAKVTWYLPDRYKKEYAELFELVGTIPVNKKYSVDDEKIKASFSAGWHHIIEAMNLQSKHEKTNSETKHISIQEFTQKKKWWKF